MKGFLLAKCFPSEKSLKIMKSPFEKGLSCEETTWYVLRAKTAYIHTIIFLLQRL